MKFCLVLLVIFCLMLSACGTTVTLTEYDYMAYCSPYCDIYGYYVQGKWCISDSERVYCCGSAHDRFCCMDSSKDVGDLYPPVDRCPNSSWWFYQWKVIVGFIATIIAMLMLSACCYFCCGGQGNNGRAARIRRSRLFRATITSSNPRRVGNIDETFDPQSPYAFVPPDYDSLPKEPPKYSDICASADNIITSSNGEVINAGYESNEDIYRNPVTVGTTASANEVNTSHGHTTTNRNQCNNELNNAITDQRNASNAANSVTAEVSNNINNNVSSSTDRVEPSIPNTSRANNGTIENAIPSTNEGHNSQENSPNDCNSQLESSTRNNHSDQNNSLSSNVAESNENDDAMHHNKDVDSDNIEDKKKSNSQVNSKTFIANDDDCQSIKMETEKNDNNVLVEHL